MAIGINPRAPAAFYGLGNFEFLCFLNKVKTTTLTIAAVAETTTAPRIASDDVGALGFEVGLMVAVGVGVGGGEGVGVGVGS